MRKTPTSLNTALYLEMEMLWGDSSSNKQSSPNTYLPSKRIQRKCGAFVVERSQGKLKAKCVGQLGPILRLYVSASVRQSLLL